MLQPECESATALAPAPWSIDEARVLEALEIRPSTRLTAQELQERWERLGPNALEEFRAVSWITIVFRQVRSFVVYLLP